MIDSSNYFPYIILSFIWNTTTITISFSKSQKDWKQFSAIMLETTPYVAKCHLLSPQKSFNKVFNSVCSIASPIFKLTKKFKVSNYRGLQLWVALSRKIVRVGKS